MIEKKTVSQCITADYCRGWNDAVDAMPQWISVEERLPTEPGEVLMVLWGRVCIAWYHCDGRFESGSGCVWAVSDGGITHWMPLPEPPEVDNNA